jgi:beta-lactamase superfamily II metal-dependent hydrolase
MASSSLCAGSAFALFCLFSSSVLAQLQIHRMDVGQGDGAVAITPGGKVILFDVGQDMKRPDCIRPVSYLEQLGVKQIDALFVSQYQPGQSRKGRHATSRTKAAQGAAQFTSSSR